MAVSGLPLGMLTFMESSTHPHTARQLQPCHPSDIRTLMDFNFCELQLKAQMLTVSNSQSHITFARLQMILPSVTASVSDQEQNCIFVQAVHHKYICKTIPSRTSMFIHLHIYNMFSKFEPMLQQFICTKSNLEMNPQRLCIRVLILDFPHSSHFNRYGPALLGESRDQRKRCNV